MATRGKKAAQAAKAFDSESQEESDQDEQLLIGGGSGLDALTQPNYDQNQNAKKREQNFIHLHFQQRNARKCLTIVRGLPEDLDAKKIARAFKKAWCCNGTTLEHEEWGTIIQLQGDHRRDIFKFLIEEGIANRELIKVHGY